MRFAPALCLFAVGAALGVLSWPAAGQETPLLSGPEAGPEPAVSESNEATFEKRLAAIVPGDLKAMLALAKWGVDHSLPERADRLYRLVLDYDPENLEAYGAVWYLAGRPLSKNSLAYRKTRADLPESFKEYETLRYVVLSDADSKWVGEQCKRLDRAYDRFIDFANRLDLRPRPLDHKLVAVVFSSLDEFAAYSKEDGNPFGRMIAGYYSPFRDRLVFYHVESNDNIARSRRQLESLNEEIDAVRRASRRKSSTGRRDEGREMLADMNDKIAAQEAQLERVNAMAREQSVSVTVHEAVHQLMFHTQVQSPYVAHPVWLSEGLATVFETDNARSAFGPFQDFAPRRERFWHLLDHGGLMPLRDLVTVSHEGMANNPALMDALYHQSYALVAWMARDRKVELRQYLRAINDRDADRSTPAARLAMFEAAFGDVDRLEEAWLRHERAQ